MSSDHIIKQWATRLKVVPDDVIDEAIKMYDEQPTAGRHNLRAVAAACLLVACKTDPLCEPITYRDVVAVSETRGTEVGRCYRKLMDIRDAKPVSCSYNPSIYVERIAAHLPLDEGVKLLAIDIIKYIREHGLMSTRFAAPMMVAGTAIYLAAYYYPNGENISQSDIGRVTGMAENTIRKYAKWMSQAMTPVLGSKSGQT